MTVSDHESELTVYGFESKELFDTHRSSIDGGTSKSCAMRGFHYAALRFEGRIRRTCDNIDPQVAAVWSGLDVGE